MEVELKKKALEQLEELSKPARREVYKALDEFEEEQFSHPDVKMIKDRDGNWIWRLKVKREHTDHRVFVDYRSEVFQILSVLHRDIAYDEEG